MTRFETGNGRFSCRTAAIILKEIHALGFYYLVTALDAPHLYHLERTFPATDGEREIIFQWFKLDNLPTLLLYPSFLRTALQSLPLSVEHRVIIHED